MKVIFLTDELLLSGRYGYLFTPAMNLFFVICSISMTELITKYFSLPLNYRCLSNVVGGQIMKYLFRMAKLDLIFLSADGCLKLYRNSLV